MTGVLHLVDGHGFLHRAYHASAGRGPTAALATFAQMIDKLERDHRAQRGAVLFDAGGRTWRHELFPAYKAHRPPLERELVDQIDRFRPLAAALGWPAIALAGYEADDVIATIVARARSAGARAIRIHASDKDLFGLVGADVLITDAVRRVELGPAEVEAKLGVPPARVADFLAIRGDDGDGVPGVPGAGDKTAAELVRRYPDIEAVIAANPKIRGKYPLSTIEGIDTLRLSRRLVALAAAAPIDVDLAELVLGRRDEAAIRELLAPPRPPEQLGLGGIPQPAPPAPEPRRTAPGFGRVTGWTRDRWTPPRAPIEPRRAGDGLTGAEREYFDERAAIRQHEGGMVRPEAERLALEDVERRFGPLPDDRRSA